METRLQLARSLHLRGNTKRDSDPQLASSTAADRAEGSQPATREQRATRKRPRGSRPQAYPHPTSGQEGALKPRPLTPSHLHHLITP